MTTSVTAMDDHAALRHYKSRLDDMNAQLSKVQRERDALLVIVENLQVLTSTTDESEEEDEQEPDGAMTTLAAGIQMLRSLTMPAEQTAMEMVRVASTIAGRSLNYQTAYKAFKRDAEKASGGTLYKNGEKFGLREWRTERS